MHISSRYNGHLAALGNVPGDHKGRVSIRVIGDLTAIEADSDKVSALIEAGSYIGVHVVRDDGSTWTCYGGAVVVEDAPATPEPAIAPEAPGLEVET